MFVRMDLLFGFMFLFLKGINCAFDCGLVNETSEWDPLASRPFTAKKMPWLTLYLATQNGNVFHYCYGAILNEYWIISAYECDIDREYDTQHKGYIIVGAKTPPRLSQQLKEYINSQQPGVRLYNRERHSPVPEMVEFAIKFAAEEAQLTDIQPRFNVLLVKSKEPMEFSDEVFPICLPPFSQKLSGQKCITITHMNETRVNANTTLFRWEEIQGTVDPPAKCRTYLPPEKSKFNLRCITPPGDPQTCGSRADHFAEPLACRAPSGRYFFGGLGQSKDVWGDCTPRMFNVINAIQFISRTTGAPVTPWDWTGSASHLLLSHGIIAGSLAVSFALLQT